MTAAFQKGNQRGPCKGECVCEINPPCENHRYPHCFMGFIFLEPLIKVFIPKKIKPP